LRLQGIQVLKSALEGSTSLMLLDLSGNALKVEGIKELESYIGTSTLLVELILAGNNFGNRFLI
jgi:Ran GTPase-activating protein (RanGAP) involved in mRNA processing and transport